MTDEKWDTECGVCHKEIDPDVMECPHCHASFCDDSYNPMSRTPKWSNKLNTLAHQITQWRASKGFYVPSSLDTEEERDAMLGKLMLVVTEVVSEAAEAIRHDHEHSFEEEIADAIIRLLDISAAMNIIIADAISRKMDINAGRPMKHGKKTSL